MICGACCTNSDENRAEGYRWYLEIDDERSPLLSKPELRKKHVLEDAEGTPHLKLDGDGRCTALRGRVGRHVSCQVYADRPRGCRLVMPGDEACLKARRERGVDVDTPTVRRSGGAR